MSPNSALEEAAQLSDHKRGQASTIELSSLDERLEVLREGLVEYRLLGLPGAIRRLADVGGTGRRHRAVSGGLRRDFWVTCPPLKGRTPWPTFDVLN